MPENPLKAKASKLCKNARKIVSARRSGAAPPLKQRRLGWKPVSGVVKAGAGQNASCSQVSDCHADTAAECTASQVPSSSQLNSSFTDRLTNADASSVCLL